MIAPPTDRRIIALLMVAAFAVGGAVGSVTTPEPKPEIHTITLDLPPACIQAIEAARQERAHQETQRQHDALAAQRSAERYDAQLSLDDDTIADAADALDAEMRLAQEADLAAADAAAAFDTAAGNCLPEREQ